MDCIGDFASLGFHHVSELLHGMLALTDSHPVTRDDNDLLGAIENHRNLFGIAAHFSTSQLVLLSRTSE